MNGFQTLWDITTNGGDSSVQKYGDECIKFYPSAHVSKDQLITYHNFQSSLEVLNFPIDHHSLKQMGYHTISITFTNLSNSQISEGFDIILKKTIFTTQMKFENGIPLIESDFLNPLMSEVRDFVRFHQNPKIQYLQETLYATNLKIRNTENGKIDIVCTDVFGNIPQMVNTLLSKDFQW